MRSSLDDQTLSGEVRLVDGTHWLATEHHVRLIQKALMTPRGAAAVRVALVNKSNQKRYEIMLNVNAVAWWTPFKLDAAIDDSKKP